MIEQIILLVDKNLEIADILIALVAFIVSIVALVYTKIYNRKKDTLYDFNRLQQEVLDKINKYSDDQIKEILEKTRITEENEKYIEITSFLSRIEHFAVGANTNIYNVKIIKRLAGKYFISLYQKLHPLIQYKQDARPKAKHYDEFEGLVKKLEKQYKREDAIKKIKEML